MNPLRFFVLAALVLGLAACDSNDPEPDANVQIEAGFEATIAPGTAEARTVQGDAEVDDELNGQFASIADEEATGGTTITAILLSGDEGAFRLLLAGLTAEALEAGTYDVAALGGADDDRFIALTIERSEEETSSIGAGMDGTVTIETATETEIAGTFSIEVSDLRGETDPVTIEGMFAAEAATGDLPE